MNFLFNFIFHAHIFLLLFSFIYLYSNQFVAYLSANFGKDGLYSRFLLMLVSYHLAQIERDRRYPHLKYLEGLSRTYYIWAMNFGYAVGGVMALSSAAQTTAAIQISTSQGNFLLRSGFIDWQYPRYVMTMYPRDVFEFKNHPLVMVTPAGSTSVAAHAFTTDSHFRTGVRHAVKVSDSLIYQRPGVFQGSTGQFITVPGVDMSNFSYTFRSCRIAAQYVYDNRQIIGYYLVQYYQPIIP